MHKATSEDAVPKDGTMPPAIWHRITAPRTCLTPLGRLLYPAAGMRAGGWPMSHAWIRLAFNICITTLLAGSTALAAYGIAVGAASSSTTAVLTTAFLAGALWAQVKAHLAPSFHLRWNGCRPAHMLIALPSRRVWIDATAKDGKGRATRHQAVLWKAACTACGNGVDLYDMGGGDQVLPMGVCREHPRNHVYGFDRDTLQGAWCGREGDDETVRIRRDPSSWMEEEMWQNHRSDTGQGDHHRDVDRSGGNAHGEHGDNR